MRRTLALTLALAACAGLLSAGARADGDPASDVLYFQDVFLPYAAPSADAARELTSTVAASNKAGFRIKVAVIASAQDLGSVPSLFDKQSLYARFLGTELRTFYRHRLLVVMPAGFGIYANGLPTDRETAALADVKIESPDPDGLTKAATAAVEKLRETIGTGTRKDSTPPTVTALTAAAKKGKPATLRYRVFDASGRSREVVRVYGPSFLLFATIVKGFAKAKPKRTSTIVWKVPTDLQTTKLKFCVLAEDPAGNQRTACAPIRFG
jgi:hypothetical protein